MWMYRRICGISWKQKKNIKLRYQEGWIKREPMKGILKGILNISSTLNDIAKDT